MNNCCEFISYKTIMKALTGDSHALNEILDYYRRYIHKMSLRKYIDAEGNEIYMVDQEMADTVEIHLMEAIIKFKPEI